MRLVHHKNRQSQREKAPRIAISQAEITADLHYPASREHARQEASTQRSSAR
jgi:hypothetical protein